VTADSGVYKHRLQTIANLFNSYSDTKISMQVQESINLKV